MRRIVFWIGMFWIDMGLFALSGCASRAPIADVSSLDDCTSAAGARDPQITASVLPLKLPSEMKTSPAEPVTLARRVTVTFAPGALQPRHALLWTKLTLHTYGGTVAGWTRIESNGVSITGSNKSDELAAVDMGPGYLNVERVSHTPKSVSSALTLDLLLRPGGVPIDEPTVRIPELWTADGKPLAPERVHIELVPQRHAPGYDLIEAEFVLSFVVSPERGAVACKRSAQVRATLVDRDAVRPALWDLGTSGPNVPRTRWLALSGPAVGVLRTIFESPQAATSFANWIRATSVSRAGEYQLGLFERDGRAPLRPLAPVDVAASRTFRPLTAQDMDALRVGPLGEP